MKLIDLNVNDFVNEVDSKSPAPGGGSVSALSSSLGVALASMVGHLSMDKKAFSALDPIIQLEFKDTHQDLIMLKQEIIQLVDKDTEAFNLIMKAYQLPKETEEQKLIRKQKIQEGTHEAILIPVKVASLSLSALTHLDIILKYGNKNTISDLGVAVLALSTGIEGACLNILINLPGIDDQMIVKQYQAQAYNFILKAHQKRDELMKLIHEKLAN
jgi:formiminotetrahydrofolate cyclodeaminase